MLDFGRHYGLTIATCVPADPASKGGSGERCQDREGRSGAHGGEPAARLRQLRRARGGVRGVLQQVNARPHRVTRRAPARCWPRNGPAASAARDTVHRGVRGDPHGAAEHPDDQRSSTGQYSVPHTLVGQTVWVRPLRGSRW